MLIEIQIYSSL